MSVCLDCLFLRILFSVLSIHRHNNNVKREMEWNLKKRLTSMTMGLNKKKKCFINSNHRHHHHQFGLYQNTAQEKPGYSLLSFRPNGKSLPNSEVNPITHTHIQIMYGKMGFLFCFVCWLLHPFLTTFDDCTTAIISGWHQHMWQQ